MKMSEETIGLVRSLYRDASGSPFTLTPGQVEIFDCIARRKYPRVRIMASTRYGKSATVAMALVTRCANYPEKWAVIAPTLRKAKILMGHALDFALQNDYTREKLELEKDENLDRLRRERSKSRLTFRMGGGKKEGVGDLFILSAEGHRTSRKGEALMGSGCLNADTMIQTDGGTITIKKIVDNKIRVRVRSFNERSGLVEWKEITGFFPNRRMTRKMFRVTVKGRNIVLTEDHPIYVIGRGFVPAKNLKRGDELLIYEGEENDIMWSMRKKILQTSGTYCTSQV